MPACMCTCTRVIPLQAEKGDLLPTNLAGFGPTVTGASGGASAAGGSTATAGAPAPTKIKLKVVAGKKDKKVGREAAGCRLQAAGCGRQAAGCDRLRGAVGNVRSALARLGAAAKLQLLSLLPCSGRERARSLRHGAQTCAIRGPASFYAIQIPL